MTFERATLEVVKHSLLYISDEMAVALRKSAFSPNIRERADHSCAILDPKGRTVGQAEQIPVHMGSFPVGLRNTLSYLASRSIEPSEGDMFLVNDPYIAGTHLNDVVLMRPVFLKNELLGFVANKAHHVDVGGMVPASISPNATELYQEGVIIPPVKIMRRNRLVKEVVEILRSNSRLPDFTRGDLRAQVAGNLLGERRVTELARPFGVNAFAEVCDEILEQTHKLALAEYGKMPRGSWRGTDYLEDGNRFIPIRARVKLSGEGVEVDFTGTHRQLASPLNAVMGVTTAAVTFAVRTLLSPAILLNDGFNRTIIIYAPEGTIVNPVRPAPVAAGNLETSQRIVDTIYRSLARALPNVIPAASQGSMNNLMMGGTDPMTGRAWAFYETIGGGYGARPGADGVSGVQVNMTNTLNTPIEVMERYYPLRFVSYKLREGSGGEGRWRGGDGIERSFEAMAQITLSVLGERCKVRPWGLREGSSGQPSRYLVKRKAGRVEKLKAKDTAALEAGDILVIRTAGGGGIGKAVKRKMGRSSSSRFRHRAPSQRFRSLPSRFSSP